MLVNQIGITYIRGVPLNLDQLKAEESLLKDQIRADSRKLEMITGLIRAYEDNLPDNPSDKTPSVSIPYADEARDFVGTWPRDRFFTIHNFAAYLSDRYAKEDIHPQSMRAPFRKLLENDLIYIFRRGEGRAAHMYKVTVPGQEKTFARRSAYSSTGPGSQALENSERNTIPDLDTTSDETSDH